MPERITRAVAPSRLHIGMLGFGQRGRRQFGGAGVMIAEPALQLTIRDSDRYLTSGPLADRINEFVAHLSAHAPWLRSRTLEHSGMPSVLITIDSTPPQHAGLGSGTQLGMALALGLSSHFDAPTETAEELARAVGRGKRSAVGVHGAMSGGFIVEAGKLRDDEISPLVCRLPLPEEWRFVLIAPNQPAGLSGEAEQRAFDRLPPVAPAITVELCRELVCELVPAARQDDFERFSEGLYRYGRLAGECFAAAQGGVYASPQIANLVDRCRALGVSGVGQSSWGPTVFALCRSRSEAENLRQTLACELPLAETLTVAPDNRGIRIERLA